jgi:hypothetical protein
MHVGGEMEGIEQQASEKIGGRKPALTCCPAPAYDDNISSRVESSCRLGSNIKYFVEVVNVKVKGSLLERQEDEKRVLVGLRRIAIRSSVIQ